MGAATNQVKRSKALVDNGTARIGMTVYGLWTERGDTRRRPNKVDH
jgi:hypothetical protein